jgi:uncharacterized protein (TIGR02246 family)
MIVFIACQPAEQRMTEAQRAAIADTVRALTNEVMAAFDQIDVDRAFSYYSDAEDAGYAEGGKLYSFEALVAQYRAIYAGLRDQKGELRESKTTVLVPDAAVLTAGGAYSMTDTTENTFGGQFAWTLVWVRRDGKWKILHSHASEVAEKFGGNAKH